MPEIWEKRGEIWEKRGDMGESRGIQRENRDRLVSAGDMGEKVVDMGRYGRKRGYGRYGRKQGRYKGKTGTDF